MPTYTKQYIICDRCQKEFEKDNWNHAMQMSFESYNGWKKFTNGSARYFLCKDCEKEFIDWFAPKIKEDSKEYNKAVEPISGESFHGESWYICPNCKQSFEFYDTQFEHGFKKCGDHLYRHTKNGCNQLLRII